MKFFTKVSMISLLICLPIQLCALRQETKDEIAANVAGYVVKEALYQAGSSSDCANSAVAGVVLKVAAPLATADSYRKVIDKKANGFFSENVMGAGMIAYQELPKIVAEGDRQHDLELEKYVQRGKTDEDLKAKIAAYSNQREKVYNSQQLEHLDTNHPRIKAFWDDYQNNKPERPQRPADDLTQIAYTVLKTSTPFEQRAAFFVVGEVATPLAVDVVMEQWQCSKRVAQLIVGATEVGGSMLVARIPKDSCSPFVQSKIEIVNDTAFSSGLGILGVVAYDCISNDVYYYFWPKREIKSELTPGTGRPTSSSSVPPVRVGIQLDPGGAVAFSLQTK